MEAICGRAEEGRDAEEEGEPAMVDLRGGYWRWWARRYIESCGGGSCPNTRGMFVVVAPADATPRLTPPWWLVAATALRSN